MGPPHSCVQVVFHRFWVPQEGSKTAKNQLKSVSKLDVFSKCLLEGLLKGLGCQIEAKTIQNNTKNWSKIDKSRPPKIQRFYKEKMKENSKEISFSNKNVENIETWKCWFFIGFYSIICISAFCTPCRNWSLHVRGEAQKLYEKWASIRGKKWEKSMKILQKLAQKWKSSKKPLPNQLFTNFDLILGSPGGLKVTKNDKKNKPKI